MDTTATLPPTSIIAYVGEDDRYVPVERTAIATAQRAAAQLILYDADAAPRVAPTPTTWSSEGSAELMGDRLTPEQLEAAGREKFALVVRFARVRGVEAYGWLPRSRGAKDLADYASRAGADLLILPADLEDIGVLDQTLDGAGPEKTASAAEAQAHIPVMTVEISPAA